MFDFVAKHKRLIQIVLFAVAVPFAFFGVESYTKAMRAGGDTVATVDGNPISQREFGDELRQQQNRVRAMFGGSIDPAEFDSPELRQSIVDSIISQRLVTGQVLSNHMLMSKEDVVSGILAAPEFQ